MEFAKKWANQFLNRPVKDKLIGMVMLVTSGSLILTSIAFIKYDIYSTKQSIVYELKLVGDIIGKRTAPGMQFIGKENKEKAEENLADLQSKKSVVLACIYKKDNSFLASYNKDSRLSCPTELPTMGSYFIDDYLVIYQPIKAIDKRTVGFIYIKSDMREINEHIMQIILGMCVLMSVILSIAFIIAYKIQEVISTPVQNLTDTAKLVTQSSDYSQRAQRFYDDELGILSDAFNTMLSEVDKRDAELSEANDTLERKVDERTAELFQALQAKSNFLSNMSHEIRTPNHAVMNCSKYVECDLQDMEKILSGNKDAPNNELIGQLLKLVQRALKSATRIRDASNRQGNLLNNILDLSKFGEGKMEMDIKINDLKIVIQNVLAESEGLYKGGIKNLEVVFKEPGFEAQAEFDFMRMTQVITNLLGNAIKYSNEGVVQLSLEQAKLDISGNSIPAIKFSISDQGIGIPAEELESIFEKFTESSNTKKQSGGTGIGLAICQEIIKLHHGKIWAENNDGKGSTFAFVMPVKQEKRDNV